MFKPASGVGRQKRREREWERNRRLGHKIRGERWQEKGETDKSRKKEGKRS